MYLSQINLKNFRCFVDQKIELKQGLNGISGENGTGKTAIIEALILTLRGQKMRAQRLMPLITYEQKNAEILLLFDNNKQKITWRSDGREAVIQNEFSENLTRTQLSQVISVQYTDPVLWQHCQEGAMERRRLMDWLWFYTDHNFHKAWQDYQRVLQQRNALLRQLHQENNINKINKNNLKFWDEKWIETTQKITEIRARKWAEFLPYFQKYQTNFKILDKIKLQNNLGYGEWNQNINNINYLSILEKNSDINLGYSLYGAHRWDMRFLQEGNAFQNYGSRGQLKLAYLCLLIAQMDCLNQAQNVNNKNLPKLLLIDDFSAELDAKNQAIILEILAELPCQTIVTTPQKSSDIGFWQNF